MTTASTIDQNKTDLDILAELVQRANRRQQYADIAGDGQPLADLIAALEDALRDARYLANHVHFWDGDERCTICGADGRA